MNKMRRAHLLLLLTSFLWGMSFSAQTAAMQHLSPFSFSASRYLLGALVLVPFIMYRKVQYNWVYVKTGCMLGLVLFYASSLQQHAMQTVSAGKAGFITSLYMVFVPIISQALFGKKVARHNWLGVLIALLGFYFLTFRSGGGIGLGDFLLLLGSFGFAMHIILIERLVGDLDPLAISATQFLTVSGLSFIAALCFEKTVCSQLFEAAGSILYVGIFSCGVAYTLQIVGQRDSEATVASIILSLEAVFSVIGAAVFLKQRLSGRELLGCALVFVAVIFVQYYEQKLAKEKADYVN